MVLQKHKIDIESSIMLRYILKMIKYINTLTLTHYHSPGSQCTKLINFQNNFSYFNFNTKITEKKKFTKENSKWEV